MSFLILFIILPLNSYGGNERALEIQFPGRKRQVVTVAAASVTGSISLSAVKQVQLLRWTFRQKYIDVSTEDLKKSFARGIKDMFIDGFIVESLYMETIKLKGKRSNSDYNFPISDVYDLRKFWASIEFRRILADVYDKKVLAADVVMNGWTINTTVVESSDYQQRFGDTFSYSFSLLPGRNVFYVRAIGIDNAIVDDDTVEFFYEMEIQSDDTPDEFAKEVFHSEDSEEVCSSCHSLELSEEIREEKDYVEDECSVCHGILVNLKSVHSPAEEYDCLMCHDPNSDPKYSLYEDKDYDAAFCFECHDDKEEDAEEMDVVHPPLEDDCMVCHDPHGTTFETQLKSKVNNICKYCHEDAAETPHPVVGHPLEGRPDPLTPGRELSCVTCHNPHASDNEYLLIAPRFSLCQKCHEK